MPGEPIYDEATRTEPFTAYLVEVLSTGGLSGSPVFVHPIGGPHHKHPTRRIGDGRIEVHTEWNQPTFLLRIVRSHYDERPAEPFQELPRPAWINKGVAAVTPIQVVLDILNYDVFKKDRREDAAEAKRSSLNP
jgi:hypothetical protein